MKDDVFKEASFALETVTSSEGTYTLVYKGFLPKRIFNLRNIEKAQKLFKAVIRYFFGQLATISEVTFYFEETEQDNNKSYFSFKVTGVKGVPSILFFSENVEKNSATFFGCDDNGGGVGCTFKFSGEDNKYYDIRV